MAALRVLFFLVAAIVAVSSNAMAQVSQPPQTQGPTRSSFTNPAEYDNYMAALNTKDPARRAQAMEVFIAWYPGSILRLEAHEQAISAWQAANQPVFKRIIHRLHDHRHPGHYENIANLVAWRFADWVFDQG